MFSTVGMMKRIKLPSRMLNSRRLILWRQQSLKNLFWALPLGLILAVAVFAQQAPTLPQITIGVDSATQPEDLAVTIQIVLLLTILTLAPSILVMMTSFVRIVIAFHFLRQALGTNSLPPNQVIIGLALFLTMFIMAPVITEIYDNAWQPYAAQEINLDVAWDRAQSPLRTFMLAHTREKDLEVFVRMADLAQPDSPDDLSMRVIIPAFIISELRVGFQMGFMLYMPLLIIDMVVAAVLI